MIVFARRPLAEAVRRTVTRKLRPLTEGDAMDVCAQWKAKDWHGQGVTIYARRGLLHVTLCAHEGLRQVATRWSQRLWRYSKHEHPRPPRWIALLSRMGVLVATLKYTRRLTLFFFIFCLSIEWCYKPSIEKIDVYDVVNGNEKFS